MKYEKKNTTMNKINCTKKKVDVIICFRTRVTI